MFTAIVISLLIFSIVLHELGHAFWMRRYGVTIHEMGLGIPVPYITLSFMWRNIRFRFSPLLLGAYVEPDKEAIRKLPWKHQADIFGAGPWANVLFGLICFASVGLSIGLTWETRHIVLVAVLGTIVCFPRTFSRYVVPVAGIPLAVYVAHSIALAPTESVMGPVGIVGFISDNAVNFPVAILLAAFLSISIGMFNLLPMMPLDAGRTVDALLRVRWPVFANVVSGMGVFVFLALIALVFYSDIARLFS